MNYEQVINWNSIISLKWTESFFLNPIFTYLVLIIHTGLVQNATDLAQPLELTRNWSFPIQHFLFMKTLFFPGAAKVCRGIVISWLTIHINLIFLFINPIMNYRTAKNN